MLVRLREAFVSIGVDVKKKNFKKHFDYAFMGSQFPFLFSGFQRDACLSIVNYIVFHICYDFLIIDEDEHLDSCVAIVFFKIELNTS